MHTYSPETNSRSLGRGKQTLQNGRREVASVSTEGLVCSYFTTPLTLHTGTGGAPGARKII